MALARLRFPYKLLPEAKLKYEAAKLSNLGINYIWMPPAYKAASGVNDTGYGVYDLYDLGEFNQKALNIMIKNDVITEVDGLKIYDEFVNGAREAIKVVKDICPVL